MVKKKHRVLETVTTVEGTLYKDEVVTFENKELDDLIIARSDGMPTYHLSVVVDDWDSAITHVIRGDDHLTNAFRQSQIYSLLEWDPPEFAHIPLIHGEDGTKMSKRHGAIGVEAYREMGFTSDALCNYLLRLGWSHGNDEIINRKHAIEWFNLENIGRGASRFDIDKFNDNECLMECKKQKYIVNAIIGFKK